MDTFSQLLRQGTLHAWFYLPAALLLGALHGLEPGHSKTMMAAFIIAVRGTVRQALLLGLCAAFSHSLIVWLLAGFALHYGSQWNVEDAKPYLQFMSGACILLLALWTAWRTHRDIRLEAAHEHSHDHAHPHSHPHEHGAHEHSSSHAHPSTPILESFEYQDPHEQAHASEIEKRFAGRPVTAAQIALFGLTGGLMPCPAAFTIVLICLQLKRVALGIGLLIAFSAGLALTLVATGALAAWSLRHAQRRFRGLGSALRKLPYLSSALLILIGLYVGIQGWLHLPTSMSSSGTP